MHQIAAELYKKIQDFIWIDWGWLSYKTKMEPVWSLYCSYFSTLYFMWNDINGEEECVKFQVFGNTSCNTVSYCRHSLESNFFCTLPLNLSTNKFKLQIDLWKSSKSQDTSSEPDLIL